MILDFFASPKLTVELPFNFNLRNAHVVLRRVLGDELLPLAARITFDFSKLNFIDPTAITILCNLIEYLKKRRVKVEYTNYRFKTDGNKFLADSGFFRRYIPGDPIVESALRSTTLPLELLAHDRSHMWIHNNFSDWISHRVGLSRASFASIKVCLEEVFNNIRDHSGESVGCVFAQHYPQRKEVVLAISDFGVGIPTNVRKVEPQLTDAAAIGRAVVEGFTTKSTVKNQGAGLNILTRYVVANNRGTVFVQSLKGSFTCNFAASGPKMSPRMMDVSYPGTLLAITFRTDYLEPIGEKEEFEW